MKADMSRSSGGNAQKIAVIASLLAASVTFLAYLPSLQLGFVSIDDPGYISANPLIRSIDPGFLAKAFTTVVKHNWHPLTIISYAIDYSLWGLNPRGYHLTNVIFHAANTFLVGLLVFRLASLSGMKDNADGAVVGLVAAIVFGLHPLHVESVAWVSERKDVVCGFFFLLSVLSYIRYAGGKWNFYFVSLGFFALSLLSKAMAVTLPFVLIILDYYPLRRLRPGRAGILKSALEKAPYFILSMALSVVTLLAQRGAMLGLEKYGLPVRLASALKAYIFYLYKMVLPFDLAPYYQIQTGASFFDPALIASVALLLSITVFCLFTDRKVFKAAWLYYLITLFPVIGLIQVGAQAAADRYTYIPGIAPSVLLGAGAGLLAKRAGKKLPVAIMAALTIALAFLTIRQEAIWKDSLTLWTYEIRIFPGRIKIAYNSRGGVYRELHDYGRALEDLNTAISLDPGYALPYNNRGLVYREVGDYGRAVSDFSTSISLDPRNAATFINRADTYRGLRDYQKALADYNAAIALDPGNSFFYNQRGLAYNDLGDYPRAIADYNAAIKADRGNPMPYNNRGSLHATLKEYGPAIEDFGTAIGLKPDFSIAYRNRGSANVAAGNFDRAIDDFTRATMLNPRDALALLYRGRALLDTGKNDRAIEDLRKALDLNPDLAGACFYLGVAYSKTGQRELASQYLKKASLMGFREADNFIRTTGAPLR